MDIKLFALQTIVFMITIVSSINTIANASSQ